MASIRAAAILEDSSKVIDAAIYDDRMVAVATDASGVRLFMLTDARELRMLPGTGFAPGSRRCVRKLLAVPPGVLRSDGDPPAFLALDEAGILTCLSELGKPITSCLALPPHPGSPVPSAGGIGSLALLHAPEPGTAAHSGVFVAATSQTGRVVVIRLVDLAACTPGVPPSPGPPALALLPLPPSYLTEPTAAGPAAMAVVSRSEPVPVVVACHPGSDDSPVTASVGAHNGGLGGITHFVATPGTGKAAVLAASTTFVVGAGSAAGSGVVSTTAHIPVGSATAVHPSTIPAPVLAAEADAESAATPLHELASFAVPTVARGAPTAAASVPSTPACPVGGEDGAAAACWAGCPALVAASDGTVSLLDDGRPIACAALAPVGDDPLVALPTPADLAPSGGRVGPVIGLAAAVVAAPDGGLLVAVGASDRTLRVFHASPADLAAARGAVMAGGGPAGLRQVAAVALPGLPTSISAAPGAGSFLVGTGVLGAPTAGTVILVRPSVATLPSSAAAFAPDAAAPAAASASSGGAITGGNGSVDRLARLVAGVRALSLSILQDRLIVLSSRATAAAKGSRPTAAAAARAEAEALQAKFGLGEIEPAMVRAIRALKTRLGGQSMPALPAECVPVHAMWSDRGSFGPAASLARVLARAAAEEEAAEAAGAAAAASSASAGAASAPGAAAAAGGRSASGPEGKEDDTDASAANDKAWLDRVALFRDVSEETGDAVVVVARWLPHRGGWVEVSRYAAAEGSTLGLAAEEDGTLASVSMRVPAGPGHKARTYASIHLLDLASPLSDLHQQICGEFGVDSKGEWAENFRQMLWYSKREGGCGMGGVSARPVATLEAAGATLAGLSAPLTAAEMHESEAGKRAFRLRQRARVAAGRDERLVGTHSRKSRFDLHKWDPRHAEAKGQRLPVPDGQLDPGDYDVPAAGAGRACAVLTAVSALPLPALGSWATRVHGKLGADTQQGRLARRMAENTHDASWALTPGELGLLAEYAVDPAAKGMGCALLIDALRKDPVRAALAGPAPPPSTEPLAHHVIDGLTSLMRDGGAPGASHRWAAMAVSAFFHPEPSHALAVLALSRLGECIHALQGLTLPPKLWVVACDAFAATLHRAARAVLSEKDAPTPGASLPALPAELFDLSLAALDRAIDAAAAEGEGGAPAAPAEPQRVVVAAGASTALMWTATVAGLVAAGAWPDETADAARAAVTKANLRLKKDFVAGLARALFA